jgi:hypothetical protein
VPVIQLPMVMVVVIVMLQRGLLRDLRLPD